jgi:hypothetical protein
MSIPLQLDDQTTRSTLVVACIRLMDEQVAAKSGLSGLALKAAYGVVKGIGPHYISGALDRLLPETFSSLAPLWQEGIEVGDPVDHLSQNRSRAADLILSVTDRKIERAKNGIVRASYQKFRQSVKPDVEEAVPGLALIIQEHASL